MVKALEENRPIERVLTEIPTPSKTVAPRFFKELGRMSDPGRLSRFLGGYLSKSETDEERTGPTEEERNRIEAALTEDLINLLPDPEGD